MNDQKTSRRRKKQEAGSGSRFVIPALVTVAIIGILLFFFWHQRSIHVSQTSPDNQSDINSDNITIPEPGRISTGIVSSESQKAEGGNDEKSINGPAESGLPGSIATGTSSSIEGNTSPSLANVEPEPEATDSFSIPGENKKSAEVCRKSAEVVKKFYAHLDDREYMQAYGLQTSSEKHFTDLLQKLLDNPPVVSGETSDLYTILQNTAHFFRIIGKDNILILKGILDREKDEFEHVLKQLFSMFEIPDCLNHSFALTVPENALYDYAGFFLNTMGGRLYLFRRDSMSRMVVSYYSILLIDKANNQASNRHGIEIKGSINRLIQEMESAGDNLKLQQIYLNKLYSLQETYQ